MGIAYCPRCHRTFNGASCCGGPVVLDEEFELEDGGPYPSTFRPPPPDKTEGATREQIMEAVKKAVAEWNERTRLWNLKRQSEKRSN
jgi:hypothetical protein